MTSCGGGFQYDDLNTNQWLGDSSEFAYLVCGSNALPEILHTSVAIYTSFDFK